MSSLPILLVNPRLLLVGGGKVAYRKAKILIENRLEFKVIAEEFLPLFNNLDLNLGMVRKQFHVDDLTSFDIVVDATGASHVADMLLREKEKRYLLVNIAASPEKSDFYFSALVNYGMLKIAVSTDGASPTVGKVVRDKIKSLIPQSINDLLQSKAEDRKAGVITPELSRMEVETVINKNKDADIV